MAEDGLSSDFSSVNLAKSLTLLAQLNVFLGKMIELRFIFLTREYKERYSGYERGAGHA